MDLIPLLVVWSVDSLTGHVLACWVVGRTFMPVSWFLRLSWSSRAHGWMWVQRRAWCGRWSGSWTSLLASRVQVQVKVFVWDNLSIIHLLFQIQGLEFIINSSAVCRWKNLCGRRRLNWGHCVIIPNVASWSIVTRCCCPGCDSTSAGSNSAEPDLSNGTGPSDDWRW